MRIRTVTFAGAGGSHDLGLSIERLCIISIEGLNLDWMQ